jgi:hypothetical protein
MHPYGFRCGQWADIVAEGSHGDNGRPTWLVSFPDGVTDVWVVDDPQGEYEFRPIEQPHRYEQAANPGERCKHCGKGQRAPVHTLASADPEANG